MTRLSRFLATALFIGGLAPALPTDGFAAAQLMCAPTTNNQAAPRTIGGTGSQVPSSTLYVLNGRGCAVIALADIGYFSSQGFVQPGELQSIIYNTGIVTGTTDIVAATLPAGAYIREILITNSVAAAVTGGISVGTTANGTDVVTAQACAASCLQFVADTNLKLRVFSLTAATPLHFAAVTAWNSANLTFTVIYGYF